MKKLISSITVLLICIASLNVFYGFHPDEQAFKLPSFVFIPNSTFRMIDAQGKSDTISVQAFYILETEVTNKQYSAFLADLKKNSLTEDLKIAFPDTINWMDEKYQLPMYRMFYHNSEVYNDFPVVNISHKAAEMYCDWLTKKYRTAGLIDQNSFFRLPEKEEIELVTKYEPGNLDAPLFFSLEDSKKADRCNYRKVDQENIFFNENTQRAEYFPQTFNLSGKPPQPLKVKSFTPNAYGIYDLRGNVAEMIRQEGIALGGSFYSFGGDIVNGTPIKFKKTSCEIGFRPVISYTGK